MNADGFKTDKGLCPVGPLSVWSPVTKNQNKHDRERERTHSMYSLIQLKTFVSCGRDPARSLPLRHGFLLIPLVLVCFAFAPQMQAVSPAPDGCYPGFTTAEGCRALNSLTTGAGNAGFGWYSLYLDTTGSYNTGLGAGTLVLNTADSNTATGAAALLLNGDGTQNCAFGTDALVYNGFGVSGADFNNAFGAFALFDNTGGYENNAVGNSALYFNINGAANTAVGDLALQNNDSDGLALGNNNAAVGAGALFNNVDGSENTAVGAGAGQNVVAGFNNTYVGDFVGTLAADESNTIRIGDLSNGNGAGSLACYIGGIFNNFQPVGGTVVEVTLDLATDELGWDVGPSNKGGTAPVQRSVPLRRSAPGSPTRPAMLNGKVGKAEKLEATVAQQQKQIQTLTAQLKEQAETFTAQLKEQAAQIQKVSARVEMIKPAPRVVENR